MLTKYLKVRAKELTRNATNAGAGATWPKNALPEVTSKEKEERKEITKEEKDTRREEDTRAQAIRERGREEATEERQDTKGQVTEEREDTREQDTSRDGKEEVKQASSRSPNVNATSAAVRDTLLRIVPRPPTR